MISVGKWRWPVLLFLTCGAVALCVQFRLLTWAYQAKVVLSPMAKSTGGKPSGPITLRGEGSTASSAMESAGKAAASFIAESLTKQKEPTHQALAKWTMQKASLTA